MQYKKDKNGSNKEVSQAQEDIRDRIVFKFEKTQHLGIFS